MEKTERKGIYVGGKDLCKYLMESDKEDYYVELTQWHNFEGYTVSMNTSMGARTFEITIQEFNLLKYLMNKLDYDDLD